MAERLTPYLRRRVLDLPIADRVALMEQLRRSMAEPVADRRDRLDYLADRMEAVSGVDVRKCHDRSAGSLWPRYLFCFVARREGYQQTLVGKFVCRDHSTVCAAEKRVNDAFAAPDQYKFEIELYNKYIESL